MTSLTTAIARLWHTDRTLTATGLLMSALAATSVVGLLIDPRLVAGAPVWLKPLKFHVSIAIFSFTLAWIFAYLPEWRRTRAIVGRSTAAIFVAEIALVNVQAWRGTTSHFNVATPLDATLFAVMGAGILLQTIATGAVAVALWRQTFTDRAVGAALRLGLTLSIAGAMTGGLMTRPTEAQLTEARATHRMAASGAHTVGAPDGGPGVPGTGWSTEHGDLRVPHFFGLHAIQALALFAVAVRRRWTEDVRVKVTTRAAASYAALFALLLWQALRGQSIVHPDVTTMAGLAIWALLTTVALAFALPKKVWTPGAQVIVS